mgnify:CR=1 FL=1
MELITRQSLANGVAQSYYDHHGLYTWYQQRSKEAARIVYEKLLALGCDPNPDLIDVILGNSTSTTFKCAECDSICELVISFDINGGEYTHEVCHECLKKAIKLIETAPKG